MCRTPTIRRRFTLTSVLRMKKRPTIALSTVKTAPSVSVVHAVTALNVALAMIVLNAVRVVTGLSVAVRLVRPSLSVKTTPRCRHLLRRPCQKAPTLPTGKCWAFPPPS